MFHRGGRIARIIGNTVFPNSAVGKARCKRVCMVEWGNVSIPQLWIGTNHRNRRVPLGGVVLITAGCICPVKFGGRERQHPNCARPSGWSNGTRGVGTDQAGIGGSLSNQASPFFTDDFGKSIKPQNRKTPICGAGVKADYASYRARLPLQVTSLAEWARQVGADEQRHQ